MGTFSDEILNPLFLMCLKFNTAKLMFKNISTNMLCVFLLDF